jgi:ATP-binding cassette subfamily B multidrug efflux pump
MSRPRPTGSRAERLLAQFHEEADAKKPSLDRALLQGLWPYIAPQRRLFLASLLLMPIGALTMVAQPVLLQRAVDAVDRGKGTGNLGWVCIQFGALILIRFIAGALETYAMQLAGQRTLAALRGAAFQHVQSLSIRYFDRTPVGRIVTRVTNDIDAIGELFASGAVTAFSDVLVLLGVVVAMFSLDPALTLVAFAVLPPLVLLVEIFRRVLRTAQRAIRTQTAQLNAFLNEQVQGLDVVQAFSREAECQAAYAEINGTYRAAYRRSIGADATLYSAVDALSTIAVGLVLWYAARRMGALEALGSAELQKGTFIAFYAYIQQFFVPVRDLSSKYTMIQSAFAAAERVLGLLAVEDTDAPRLALPASASRAAEGPVPAVQLDHVDFRYSPTGPLVLSDVSFRVEPGQTVAIVGATGAGKSTVIALLARFYEVASGSVRLFGRDVRTFDRTELRKAFTVVQQDVFLFAGSLLSNIALGEDAPDAARALEALERIGALSLFAPRGGLDMAIAERGANLSAGERQLVAFARALYRNAAVLVLDEATANVDSETEARLQVAVDAVRVGRTALVIAHRLSTIRKAARVLVFHRGRLVEQGTHAELLAQGGIYARLHTLQFAEAATRGEHGST